MFDSKKKQEIAQKIETRLRAFGHGLRCPMCNHTKFSIADAYVTFGLQDDLNAMSLGGPSIPAAAIVCENCGFISTHALGVLGMLPPPGGKT
jgi:hypothetical protein